MTKKPIHDIAQQPAPKVLVYTGPITETTVIPHRSILVPTYRRYGVAFRGFNGELRRIDFNYNGRIKGRNFSDKIFGWLDKGEHDPLFGMSVFPAKSHKHVIVTEGEFDALSAHQMTGVPAVSVQSSSSAVKNCTDAYDYLSSFDKIYLCLDNDNPGKEATKKLAKLFDPGKVYIMELGIHKDANDMLCAGKIEDFKQIYFNTKMYRPRDIISGWKSIEKIIKRPDAPTLASFPFPTLQEKTRGIRPEVYLFTAMEGVGKTEIMRSIEHHVLKTTDHNIGIIHLEEPVKDSVERLAGYELHKPIHLLGAAYSEQQKLDVIKQLFVREDRVYLYPQLNEDDPKAILSTIRWLVQGLGCKILFLDHISLLVSDYEGDDERRKLDYISTKLEKLVLELEFALIMVSHLNDDGKTRGSRNISKCAMTWIQMDREMESDSSRVRNTTKLTIKKNRFASYTGPSAQLYFDPETFLITEDK